MKIVLASRNKNKIAELKTLFDKSDLGDIELLSLDDIGAYDDIEENGSSFEENSLIKASVPASLGYIGIADDSGLCVDALSDEPGIYSARYSGENATYLSNNQKLVENLKGIPPKERTARFVCVVSCVIPHDIGFVPAIPNEYDVSTQFGSIVGASRAFCVRGECHGVILEEAAGENGFGYDPLFYISDKGKTFAQLSSEEKNAISHRGNAMRSFIEVLKTVLRGQTS